MESCLSFDFCTHRWDQELHWHGRNESDEGVVISVWINRESENHKTRTATVLVYWLSRVFESPSDWKSEYHPNLAQRYPHPNPDSFFRFFSFFLESFMFSNSFIRKWWIHFCVGMVSLLSLRTESWQHTTRKRPHHIRNYAVDGQTCK